MRQLDQYVRYTIMNDINNLHLRCSDPLTRNEMKVIPTLENGGKQ